MKRKLCSAVAGTLAAVLCIGCGNTADTEQALTPVRLNEVVHSVFYAPQYVAQEMGFFEEEGLDVTVTIGNGAERKLFPG